MPPVGDDVDLDLLWRWRCTFLLLLLLFLGLHLSPLHFRLHLLRGLRAFRLGVEAQQTAERVSDFIGSGVLERERPRNRMRRERFFFFVKRRPDVPKIGDRVEHKQPVRRLERVDLAVRAEE